MALAVGTHERLVQWYENSIGAYTLLKSSTSVSSMSLLSRVPVKRSSTGASVQEETVSSFGSLSPVSVGLKFSLAPGSDL